MKVTELWKDSVLFLILMVFLTLAQELFLMLFNSNIFLKIFIPLGAFSVMFFLFCFEQIRKKTFYQKLFSQLQQLEQKYIINEVMDKPHFEEGKLIKEILDETGKSMIDHVNYYKFSMQEYREYIELWVHEIKTPIATSKMIIENNPSEVTSNMEEEIDKVDQFVEQALYYARSNNVEKDYIIKECHLKTIINQVIRKNKKDILLAKIKIELLDLDKVIYSDSKWLEFIVNQIIVNSIKYRTSQDAEIEIYAREYKEGISLYIRDNGIGMERKDLGKVFEKGYTGENGRNKTKATGMGLYLCKKLCDKLGHGIEINSKLGKGTEIKINFPKNSMIKM